VTGARIVVGVDGSAGSKAALSWALGEGSARGADVEAVICWSGGSLSRGGRSDPAASADDAMTLVARMIGEAKTRAAEGSTEVRGMALEGHPAQLLPEAAVGAELLVVGSRGHGAFVGTVLGSVSLAVVSRSPCAVVVVPDQIQSQHRSAKLTVHARGLDDDMSSEASRWQAMRGGREIQTGISSTRDPA
jgi:nucleotide-binding universal stress UspA family protein